MSNREKEKRLSRILSPTRFRPAPHMQENTELITTGCYTISNNLVPKPTSPSGSASSDSSCCSSSLSSSSVSTSSSITPPSYTPNSSYYGTENNSSSSTYSVPVYNQNINNYVNNSLNQYSEPFDKLSDNSRDQDRSLNETRSNLFLIRSLRRSDIINRTNNNNNNKNNKNNRLFFNFNSNNGYIFNDGSSVPVSPAHNNFSSLTKIHNTSFNLNKHDSSVSVPTTPRFNRKASDSNLAHNIQIQQPVLKVLKQKANLFTEGVANSVTACGGGSAVDDVDGVCDVRSVARSNSNVTVKSKESILNRLFNRSKSKEKFSKFQHGKFENTSNAESLIDGINTYLRNASPASNNMNTNSYINQNFHLTANNRMA